MRFRKVAVQSLIQKTNPGPLQANPATRFRSHFKDNPIPDDGNRISDNDHEFCGKSPVPESKMVHSARKALI
jgi:hypothetical protein